MIRLRLAAVVVVMVAAGCGGEVGGEDGEQRESVDIRFTREDGSSANFPQDVRAWCGPFDEDNADVEGVHVLAGVLPPEQGSAEPFWFVRAVRADIERDPETRLPNDFVYTEPRGAAFFALDAAEHRHNELSSASERSAGAFVVELSGCERGDTVEVRFDDVTLGSEFGDQPSITVDGSTVVHVGDPP
jgi:hypothetical protein